MVGRQGFEPWTNGLKGRCSTTELPTHTHEIQAAELARIQSGKT
jgi:hypothetical protein